MGTIIIQIRIIRQMRHMVQGWCQLAIGRDRSQSGGQHPIRPEPDGWLNEEHLKTQRKIRKITELMNYYRKRKIIKTADFE